ncbi:MAG TPA: hypothetical protein VER96_25155 [Polyangiaceae bacterium]|nr:hypothetical protein [Polyangiaceae bacterium]
MFDKSAADFMNDQLEALLASPALARVAQRQPAPSDEPAASEQPIQERDTEPSIDVKMLRDAMRAGLK